MNQNPITSNGSRRHELILSLGLFSFLFGVYLLSFSGVFHSGDDAIYIDSAAELLRGGAGWPSHGGLFPVALAGVLAVTRGVNGIGTVQAMLLVNIAATAASAVLLFHLGRELHYEVRAALLVALICGLATPLWFYSKVLFREGFMAMWLAAAAFFSVRFGRRFTMLALGLALFCWFAAVVTRVYSAVAFVFGLAYLCLHVWERRKTQLDGARAHWTALLVLLPVLALIAIGVASWHYRPLLGELISANRVWEPLAGLLFSPARGLLLYAPVVLVSAASLLPFSRRHPYEAFLLYGSFLAYLLLIARHPSWSGGWSWGPRLLISYLPFVVFPIIALLQPVLSGQRRTWPAVLIAVVCLLSVVVQGIAVTFGANMIAFMAEPGASWVWDPKYAPVVWPLSEFKRVAIDLAWAHLEGAPSDTIAAVAPVALLTLQGAAILARYHRFPPASVVRLGLISAGVIAVSLGAAGWTLHRYYLLDARYDPDSGLRSAMAQVRRDALPGDVLVLDHRLLDDQHIARSRVYNDCRGQCPPLTYFAREPWQQKAEEPNAQEIERVASAYERIWLVPYRYATGDPNSVVEHALSYRTYKEKCDWLGPAVRLCLFRNPPEDGLSRRGQRVESIFGDKISLRESSISWRASGEAEPQKITPWPGETLYVDLVWAALTPLDRNYKVSMQLLDADGHLVHQQDREPVDGFRRTTSWMPGENIPDKYAFVLPTTLPAGRYRLLLALYEPETQKRLPTVSSDSLKLADVEVSPGMALQTR